MIKFKDAYLALILSFALAYMIEFVMGYTNAWTVPKSIYEFLGMHFGHFIVGLLTITLPYFLVALIVMPALVVVCGKNAPKYSVITLFGVLVVLGLSSSSFVFNASNFVLILPVIMGLLSIVLATYIVTNKLRLS